MLGIFSQFFCCPSTSLVKGLLRSISKLKNMKFSLSLSFEHSYLLSTMLNLLAWLGLILSVLNSVQWFSSFDDHPALFGHYWSWNPGVLFHWLYSFQSPHGCSRSFTFLFGVCYFLPPQLGLPCWGSQCLKNTCRHKFIPHASGCPGAHCHSNS